MLDIFLLARFLSVASQRKLRFEYTHRFYSHFSLVENLTRPWEMIHIEITISNVQTYEVHTKNENDRNLSGEMTIIYA